MKNVFKFLKFAITDLLSDHLGRQKSCCLKKLAPKELTLSAPKSQKCDFANSVNPDQPALKRAV